MKTTHLLRLFKDTNLISFTLTSMINKRLLNIISKQPKVQTIVLLNLKLDPLIRILLLRFLEKSGTLLKSQGSNRYSIKVFCSFTLILKSLNSEFDIYQNYSHKFFLKVKKYESIIFLSLFIINIGEFEPSNKVHSFVLVFIVILFILFFIILSQMLLLK